MERKAKKFGRWLLPQRILRKSDVLLLPEQKFFDLCFHSLMTRVVPHKCFVPGSGAKQFIPQPAIGFLAVSIQSDPFLVIGEYPVFGPLYQICIHGIEVDVSTEMTKIVLIIYVESPEVSLEKMAASPVPLVVRFDVRDGEGTHHIGKVDIAVDPDKEVIVVRHETVGRDFYVRRVEIVMQSPQEEPVVFRFHENLLLVVPTVINVVILSGYELYAAPSHRPPRLELRLLTWYIPRKKLEFLPNLSHHPPLMQVLKKCDIERSGGVEQNVVDVVLATFFLVGINESFH